MPCVWAWIGRVYNRAQRQNLKEAAVWVLFQVPCPTPDGQPAEDLYQKHGETAVYLEGDVGLVALPDLR